MSAMRIRQYAYLGVSSETMTARAMESAIGLSPDAIRIRGSQHPVAPRPRYHRWMIECRERGLRVDEQVTQVLNRVEPFAERINRLSATPGVSVCMQVVRYFADKDGEEEAFEGGIDEDGGFYERLSGQHQLLGWRLTHEQLCLILALGAALDADEYN